jgi:hypothetical protein
MKNHRAKSAETHAAANALGNFSLRTSHLKSTKSVGKLHYRQQEPLEAGTTFP